MIYTFTYQRALNFGASLQAYALAKFLNNQGLETQIVDYLPHYMHWQTKRPMKSLKGTIEKYKKYKKFSQFRGEFMPITDKTYFSKKALRLLPNPRAFVVGSDQVWNPNLHGETKSQVKPSFDMTYLLDINTEFNEQNPKPKVKKVAYAASAGSVRFNEVAEPDVINAVKQFDAIGCREQVLEQDIKAIFNDDKNDSEQKREAQTVLDPSLLLRDYSELEIVNLCPSQDYVVSYVVGSGEMLSTFNQRVAEAKNCFGLPVIHLGAKSIESADYNLLDIGPREWLTYIKNAKYVVTNSFHGCAFSLNFNRQFILIPHKLNELNQRQKTLLNGVGLEERLLDDGEKVTKTNLATFDYRPVNNKLYKLIEDSKEFLLKALKAEM